MQSQSVGVFFNDQESFNGYTLFTNNESTYLIDNCGYIVNDWESDYWCNNGLELSKEGKLVRQGKVPSLNIFGGTAGVIEIFDWHNNLEWQYLFNDSVVSHHDLLLMPNGNILVNVWERIEGDEAENSGREVPGIFYNEQIWEIKPLADNKAEVVWKWSFLDHVIQDVDSTKENYGNVYDHPELLDINYIVPDVGINADWLHCNTLGYHEEFDQIVLSARNTSEIYVIDHSTTAEEAATGSGGSYGKGGDILYRYGNPEAYDHGTPEDRILFQSHDVDWITHGPYKNDFIVFNNKYISSVRSRIQIWENPTTNGTYEFSDENLFGNDQILWTYDTTGFYSSIMSNAQYLPNGNILTTEGSTGEITEITPSGTSVWNYINPVDKSTGPVVQGDFPQNNSLFKCRRYEENFTGFENFELIPGERVELMPEEDDCLIVPFSSVNTIEYTHPLFRANHQTLQVVNQAAIGHSFILYSITGQKVMQFFVTSIDQYIDIRTLRTGVYIISGGTFVPQKIFK
ncbi:MAG: aryl-sulfate sulfotransferase [Bacteroidota bacterium]